MDNITAGTAEAERELEIPEVEGEEVVGQEVGEEEQEQEQEKEESPGDRITRLTEENASLQKKQDRVAAAARREEKEKRLKAEAELASLKKKNDAGPRPTPPDHKDYEDALGETNSAGLRTAQMKYDDDLHDWRQAQAPAPAPVVEPESTGSSDLDMARDTFLDRSEAMRAEHDDFEEVCSRKVFPADTLERVTAAIFKNEAGPEIAYYLGNNPAEADRIGNLDHDSMNQEIGVLKAQLSGPPATRAKSNAPAPINPVGGNATVAKDPDKMTDEEWSAWDDQQTLKQMGASPGG